MPRRLRLRTVLPALAAAAALVVAPAATAETDGVPDPRSDYWHDTRSSGEDPYPGNPDWGNPDLRRAGYAHGPSKVRVRLRMARLNLGDGGYWEAEARFLTNEGVKARIELFKPTDSPKRIRWFGPGDCDADGTISFSDDVFVLEVPRSCLSNPRTVAFKAATRWWPTSDDYPYLDVAGSDGYRLNTWSPALTRG